MSGCPRDPVSGATGLREITEVQAITIGQAGPAVTLHEDELGSRILGANRAAHWARSPGSLMLRTRHVASLDHRLPKMTTRYMRLCFMSSNK